MNNTVKVFSPKNVADQRHVDSPATLGRPQNQEMARAVTRTHIHDVQNTRLLMDQPGQPPRRGSETAAYLGYEANSAHGSVHAGHQLVPSNHHSPSGDQAASHSLPDHHQTPSGEC